MPTNIQSIQPQQVLINVIVMLVLNLGHSPLYRLLQVPIYWVVKNFTCFLLLHTFSSLDKKNLLSLFSVIENVGVLVISYLLLPHLLAFQTIQLVLIDS